MSFPIELEDGSTVNVVRETDGSLVAEDGSEYAATGNGFAHVKVGETLTPAEMADVEETGEKNPEAPAEDEAE